MINIFIKSKIDKYSKYYFVKKLNSGNRVLDVGCGNHSATKINFLNNNLLIDGIDIVEYNTNEQDKKIMNNYFIVEPTKFNSFIEQLNCKYDAIVCSHVIEHVEDLEELLIVLMKKLERNGLLYLSFPNESSIHFPRRIGTLNFFDDNTHANQPPNLQFVENIIRNNNCIIIKKATPNKILIGYLLGLLLEPISAITKKVLPFTWYYWGFENVLIIQKN